MIEIMKHAVSLFLITVFSGFSQGAVAGILEDYQQAHRSLKERRRPCETLPFSDLRDECLRKSEIVNNDCKIVQWTCEGEMREFHDMKGLLKDKKAKQTKVEELKKETDKHNDKIRPSKDSNEISNLKKLIEANDREIYELKRGIDNSDREIGGRKEKIQKRIEWAKRCIVSREEVQKLFESAISKAKSENSDNIRSMRDDLIAEWEPSVKSHNQPLSDIKNGIRKCEEIRDQRD